MYNTVEREDFNVKIEKNISIPKARDKNGGKYGIVDEMEVGDSVLCSSHLIHSVSFRARSKNPQKTFVSRKEGKTHTRLWRTV